MDFPSNSNMITNCSTNTLQMTVNTGKNVQVALSWMVGQHLHATTVPLRAASVCHVFQRFTVCQYGFAVIHYINPLQKQARCQFRSTKMHRQCTVLHRHPILQNHRQLLWRNCSPFTRPAITNKMHKPEASHRFILTSNTPRLHWKMDPRSRSGSSSSAFGRMIHWKY